MGHLNPIAAIAACALVTGAADAQTNYPNKPIRMIVPLAAGSAVDNAARIVAQKMGQNMGQSIVIDGGQTLPEMGRVPAPGTRSRRTSRCCVRPDPVPAMAGCARNGHGRSEPEHCARDRSASGSVGRVRPRPPVARPGWAENFRCVRCSRQHGERDSSLGFFVRDWFWSCLSWSSAVFGLL